MQYFLKEVLSRLTRENNMSGQGGRYGGRSSRGGRGHGGQGQGRGYWNNSRSSNNKSNEIKFAPQSQGKTMTATYNTVKETRMVQIQKSYKNGQDVVTCLKQESKLDLLKLAPKHEISKKSDADEKEVEQRALDIKYQEELRRHLDHCDELEQGFNKAYALIFTNYCTRPMQRKIKEHPDFATKIEDDAIQLLEVIKTLMHDTVRSVYPMSSIVDALA